MALLQRCMDGNGTCSPEEIQLLIGGQAPWRCGPGSQPHRAHTTDYAWFVYYLGLAAQVCYETVQVSNRTRALVKAWKVPIEQGDQASISNVFVPRLDGHSRKNQEWLHRDSGKGRGGTKNHTHATRLTSPCGTSSMPWTTTLRGR